MTDTLATKEAPTATSSRDPVRPVTDQEVAFFIQNGWVLLRGLLSPEVAGEMLKRGKARLAEYMETPNSDTPGGKQMNIAETEGKGSVSNIGQWLEWRGAVRSAHDPAFSSATLSKTMGRNVRRLLERDISLRIYHDIFVCKLPDLVSTPTYFHQDSVSFPLDRNVLTVWMALDEITPDQGPVQFLSGSHQCGLMGKSQQETDIVGLYPKLGRFPVSPPNHLQPGDCTVHHGLVVHGASANDTPRHRWSYLASYFPTDALYTGAPNHDTDGFGLKKGRPIDHPSFSQVAE